MTPAATSLPDSSMPSTPPLEDKDPSTLESQAPETPEEPDGLTREADNDASVIRRRRGGAWYALVGLALALCMVLAFVVPGPSTPTTTPPNDKKPPESDEKQPPEWTVIGQPIDATRQEDYRNLALSLSDDGATVAVGHRDENGRVRIYQQQSDDSDDWMQWGSEIQGDDRGQSSFGAAVSLAGNGQSIAIGAYLYTKDELRGLHAGMVQVWRHSDSVNDNGDGDWRQVGQSVHGDGPGDHFGSAVALNQDGTMVAVGGHLNSQQAQRAGHVRVYRLQDDAVWQPVGQELTGRALGDQFGRAVALSSAGTTLVVGARFYDDAATNQTDVGHVRAYYLDATTDTWVQLGSDMVGSVQDEEFGYSVALSGDGTTVAVGNGENEICIFRLDSVAQEWLQVGDSLAVGPPNQSGEAVPGTFLYASLSKDGTVLAVLEERRSGGPHYTVVLKFDASTNRWVQVGSQLSGEVMALSGDGDTLAMAVMETNGTEYVQVLQAF